MDAGDTSQRRAYIGRGRGADFFGYVTDIATEHEIYDEGEWSTVEAALVWARELANEVVLTYGGSESSVFSAGATYYQGVGKAALRRWPPDETARAEIDRAVRLERDNPPPARSAGLSVERPMIVREDAPEHSQ
ncbi:MAG TPA: hypothetical protein VK778_04085 [Solirubrobacteraceae bacterium]|jgi:hypothetical protein|nr:hypothetical protein [Solirubrobacteraceae bacterium]